MGFTSGYTYAESDDSPFICVTLNTGETRELRIPYLPSDEYTLNKGDLWPIPISSFGFSSTNCITYSCITQVLLREGGNDGWNIASIMSVLRIQGAYKLLTADFNVNRWIDGNGQAYQKQFKLRKV